MDINSLDFGNDSRLTFVVDTSGGREKKKGLGVRQKPQPAATEKTEKLPPVKRKRNPKPPTTDNTSPPKYAKIGGKPASSVETIETEIKGFESDMQKSQDEKLDIDKRIIETEKINQDSSQDTIISALHERKNRIERSIKLTQDAIANAKRRLTAAKKKESNNKTLLEKKEEEDTKRAEWLLVIEERKQEAGYINELNTAKARIEPLKRVKKFKRSINIVFKDSLFILDYIHRNDDEGYICMLLKAPEIEGTIEWFNCADIIDERMKQDSKKKK